MIITPTHVIHVTIPSGSTRDVLPIFTARALDHYRTMIPVSEDTVAPDPAAGRQVDGEGGASTVDASPLPAPSERMSTYVFEKEETRAARREQAKALLQTLPQFKGKAKFCAEAKAA